MSLFIALLAFDETAWVDAAKIAILVGSLLASLIAAIILKWIARASFQREGRQSS
jgi:Na+/H+ antiporter NhaA